MANYHDIELARARAALTSLEAKIEQHRRGQNLTATGQPKVDIEKSSELRLKAGTGSTHDVGVAVRRSLRGIQVTALPGSGLKSDNHITGISSTYKKTWARDWGADGRDLRADKSEGKKGAAIRQSPKFWQPISRPIRPASPEGVTSFHYSVTFVSKVSKNVVAASGARSGPGSAREHSRYLEREGAVATAPAGAEIVAGREAPAPSSEMAREGSDYIERQEAMASNAVGEIALFSNISADPEERREFWGLVEHHASKRGSDKVLVQPDANPILWSKVRADPKCPDAVRTALEDTRAGSEVMITVESNSDFKRLLQHHGWQAPRRRRKDETFEDYEAEITQHGKETGLTFYDARGGLVQIRMVGELPCEITHEARVRIIKGMAAPFDEHNLPYTIVMHAPDHSNNDKNWHFHLIAHDRPVARFVNDPLSPTHDHLRPSASDGPRVKTTKARALDAIGSATMEQFVGRWDFDVPLKTKRKSRRTDTSYPFGRNKLRHLPIFKAEYQRALLARLTNTELKRAGCVRRVDPRTYEEMGIDREPDEHLSTRRSQLEDRGIPTDVGQRNEARQWRYQLRVIEKAHAKALQDLEAEVLEMRQLLAARDPTQQATETGESLVRAYEDSHYAAIEQHRIARLMSEHHDRAASRAQKVEKVSKRHLAAIKAGIASRQLQRQEQEYRDSLDEAQAHLAGLAILLADEVAQVQRSREAAKRHNKDAVRLRAEFEEVVERAIREAVVADALQQQPNIKSSGPQTEAQQHFRASADLGCRQSEARSAPRLLTEKEKEDFIQFVLDHKIRLVNRNRVVVPKVENPQIAAVVAAVNYCDLKPRLADLHQKQNALRDDLLNAITKDPALVERRERQDGLIVVALKTPDRRMQDGMGMFFDDPRVAKALQVIFAAEASTDDRTSIPPEDERRKEADTAATSSTIFSAIESWQGNAETFDIAAERRRIEAGRKGQPRVQELRRGVHRLIDQWIIAKDDCDNAARQSAADAIHQDSKARIRLKPLTGLDVEELRFDLAAAEERALRKEEAQQRQQQQLAIQQQHSKWVG